MKSNSWEKMSGRGTQRHKSQTPPTNHKTKRYNTHLRSKLAKTMKRLTEEKTDDRDKTASESEESIHHIKEINKLEEKNKHYPAIVEIDTGSPIYCHRTKHI